MISIEARLKAAWKIHQTGNVAAAIPVYREVLNEHPDHPIALCYLGIALRAQKDHWGALKVFRRALELNPRVPERHINLASVLTDMGRFTESEAALRQALTIKPDIPEALMNLGNTLAYQARFLEAAELYRQAISQEPDYAKAHLGLGIVRLRGGEFAAGWPEFEWRCRIPDSQTSQLNWPRWDGSSLDGKTILLLAEQGLGDSLQFIRYAAELKQRFRCRVIAAMQKPLLGLLASCAGIDELVPRASEPPVCDCWSPLMSLPGLLGQNSWDSFAAEIPYLRADPARQARWKQELSRWSGFRIGILWQGEKLNPVDARRSVPLAEFAPLGRLNGVTLISLQKHDGLEQLDQLSGRFDVVTLGDDVDSAGAFLDTAAIMSGLDLIIAADTAPAHLAGALGVPVWLALQFVADWRWQVTGDTTPWYPSMRLFRQPKLGDWTSVFERIAAELMSQQPTIRLKTPHERVIATSDFNRLTRAKYGLMLFNRNDRYIGRSIELYGEFSDEEVEVFRQIVRPGDVVVEVGANIGAHTLPLAKQVGDSGMVHAFEPQRMVFQTLCANIALNGLKNVICRWEAVGDVRGTINVPQLDCARLNNFGGLSLQTNADGEPVPVTTIDSLNLLRCNFLKADVEGMELSVLRGAQQTIAKFRPVLYVENDRPEQSSALIEYLMSLGYVLYWHRPFLFNPRNAFQNTHNEFPNMISANMLCFHNSVKTNISGLPRIISPDGRAALPT